MKKLFLIPLLAITFNSYGSGSHISDSEFATLITIAPTLTTLSPLGSTIGAFEMKQNAEAIIADVAIYDIDGDITAELAADIEKVKSNDVYKDMSDNEIINILSDKSFQVLELLEE